MRTGARAQINLDLWLRAARAHERLFAVRCGEAEHVAPGQAVHALRVVLHHRDRAARQRFNRRFSQPRHHRAHRVHRHRARNVEAQQPVLHTAVARVERIQLVRQRASLRGGGLRHLRDEHARHHAVLVAHVRARQIAAALLKAKDEALRLARRFEPTDDLADVLEARQALAHLCAVVRRDGEGEVAGDDRLDGDGMLR